MRRVKDDHKGEVSEISSGIILMHQIKSGISPQK